MKNIISLLIIGFGLGFGQDHDHHTIEMEETPDHSMSFKGSGTSWLPESTPLYASMIMTEDWMLMSHGNFTLRYTDQGGKRGGSKISAPNWYMIMAERNISEATSLMLTGMFSLDRVFDGGEGYPLLFQSGETWKGKPLVDRQHPHDLFAELSVQITTTLTDDAKGFLYIGYPGEPALGAPAFMHRTSALINPDAPISHHWQDATHITFGVATLGVEAGIFRLEGSLFTGKEPDENRFDFDKPRFDSYSGRISINPSDDLAFQISSSSINEPEGHVQKLYRTTSSVLYNIRLNEEQWLSNSFVWGQNVEAHVGSMQSFLFESTLNLTTQMLYTRFENVQKPREELGIETGHDILETVRQLTVGGAHSVGTFIGVDLYAGAQVTFYSMSKYLESHYGTNPISYQFYITIIPTLL